MTHNHILDALKMIYREGPDSVFGYGKNYRTLLEGELVRRIRSANEQSEDWK